MALSKLTIDLAVGLAGFESDMGRAAKTTERQMAAMKRDAEMMGKALGAAFVATAAAVAVVVNKSIDAADHMRDLSLKTGISTEALSQYDSVAAKTGTTLDAFVSGVNKMQRSLIAAAEGGATQTAAFQKLGLSVNDLLKLEPDKQFEAIAEELSKLGNAAERTATAQEIFGKGVAALAPLMAEGAAGIEEARAKAEAFGISIGQDFADNADRFNDNMRDISDISKGISNQFTAGLLPALIDLQEGFIGMDRDISAAQKTGESLGAFIKQLVAAFIVLKQVVTALGVTLVSTFATIVGAIAAIISPLTGLGLTLERVVSKISGGDVLGGLKEFQNVGADIAKTFNEGAQAMINAGGATADAWGPELQAALDKAFKVMNSTTDSAKKVESGINKVTGAITKTSAAVREWTARQAAASRSIDENIKFVEELERSQQDYNTRLQELKDIANPVAALVRHFAEQVEFANLALNHGLSPEEYRQALNALSDELGRAAAATRDMADATANDLDTATILMISSLDHLNQITQSIWQDMFSGADSVFEGIFKSFQAMLADMIHEATTQQIIIQAKAAFDGDSSTAVDYKKLGDSFATFAGVLAGSALGGGGQGANIGSGIGAVAGGIIGSVVPVIGTAIGAFIGGILGGLVGGLFDKNKTPTAQASGFNNFTNKGTNLSFDTVFGKTFLHTRHVDAEGVNALKQSITDFDKTIGAMLDDSQIDTVTEALKKWNTSMAGEAITAENLLGERFKVILSTFSQTLQDFVNEATDLNEQMMRLQVGVGVENIMKARPDLFAGRSVADFLAVVAAFQNGVETMGDAFNEVVALLDIVVGVTDSLKAFAGSDLQGDFNALLAAQDITIGQALAGVNSLLMDAVANFDGSIESLQNIGVLVSTVREGEIKYLSQLNQLQKGLNTTLDQLRADILGLTATPKNGAELFNEARGLVAQVLSASTPEEIAALTQQFNSLIRSISPEDQIAMQGQIVQLIGSFQSAANDMINQFRTDALDNAAAMRDLVDVFVTDIGDPLAIIAATNERAATALEILAGMPQTTTPEFAGVDTTQIGIGETTGEANALAVEQNRQVMEDGLYDIAQAVAQGGNITAAAVAEALRNVVLRPTFILPDNGLTNS